MKKIIKEEKLVRVDVQFISSLKYGGYHHPLLIGCSSYWFGGAHIGFYLSFSLSHPFLCKYRFQRIK
jgi:hypothetical protein